MGSRLFLAIVLLAVPLGAGCASGNKAMPDWSGSFDEQRQSLLEIAPLGTDREEVAQRLQDAGIEFSPNGADEWSPGMNASVFYCHRWAKDQREPLPLNVSLLFDPQGKLYEVRRSEAAVEQVELLPPSPRSPASVVADLSASSDSLKGLGQGDRALVESAADNRP